MRHEPTLEPCPIPDLRLHRSRLLARCALDVLVIDRFLLAVPACVVGRRAFPERLRAGQEGAPIDPGDDKIWPTKVVLRLASRLPCWLPAIGNDSLKAVQLIL